MKKPKYRLFTILSVVFLILGILMTTVGGHFSTVLTVAMEGSTTDKETAEMTYADGLAMNVELEEEGLADRQIMLPVQILRDLRRSWML